MNEITKETPRKRGKMWKVVLRRKVGRTTIYKTLCLGRRVELGQSYTANPLYKAYVERFKRKAARDDGIHGFKSLEEARRYIENTDYDNLVIIECTYKERICEGIWLMYHPRRREMVCYKCVSARTVRYLGEVK